MPFDEFQDRFLERLDGVADARRESASIKMDSIVWNSTRSLKFQSNSDVLHRKRRAQGIRASEFRLQPR